MRPRVLAAVLAVLALSGIEQPAPAAPPPPAAPSPTVASASDVSEPAPPRPAVRRPAPPPTFCIGAVACVDTSAPAAWLFDGARRVLGPVPVSLGSPDQPTPRGAFTVVWKDAEHTSSTYGLPMDFAVFFAADGIAFHEGDVREPSHGCVHLRPADARRFFSQLQPGDRVVVR